MCEINWEVVVGIIGILVNSILAIWIVKKIQKSNDNERFIKNHFINEVLELRTDFRNFLNQVYAGRRNQNEIISSLKLLGIKSTDLLKNLNYCFQVEQTYFNSYIIEMNKIITDDYYFVSKSNTNAPISLTDENQNKLLKLQANYQNRFNDLVLCINEQNYKALY